MAVKWKQPCQPGAGDGHVLSQQQNPTNDFRDGPLRKVEYLTTPYSRSPSRGRLGIWTAQDQEHPDAAEEGCQTESGSRSSQLPPSQGSRKPGNAKHSI